MEPDQNPGPSVRPWGRWPPRKAATWAGRPLCGYLLIDLGSHPNPSKAADGKRLHGYDLDPQTAPVVVRIFAEYLAGRGLGAIAEGPTREVPAPVVAKALGYAHTTATKHLTAVGEKRNLEPLRSRPREYLRE